MKKLTALILCLVMLFAVAAPVMAADTNTIAAAERDMAAYIYQTVPDPQVGSIGGEWAVLGLARSSADISSEYYQKYYQTLEKYVKIHLKIPQKADPVLPLRIRVLHWNL